MALKLVASLAIVLSLCSGCSDDESSPVPEFQMPVFEKGLTPTLLQATTEYLSRGTTLFEETGETTAANMLSDIQSELQTHQAKLVGQDPPRPLSSETQFSATYEALVRQAAEGCTLRSRREVDQPGGSAGVVSLSVLYHGHTCQSDLSSSNSQSSSMVPAANGTATSQTRSSSTWRYNLALATERTNTDGVLTAVTFASLDPVKAEASGSVTRVARPLNDKNYLSPGQDQSTSIYSGSLTTKSGEVIIFRRSETFNLVESKKFENLTEVKSTRSVRFALETPYGNYVHEKQVVNDPDNFEEPTKTTISINGVDVTAIKL